MYLNISGSPALPKLWARKRVQHPKTTTMVRYLCSPSLMHYRALASSRCQWDRGSQNKRFQFYDPQAEALEMFSRIRHHQRITILRRISTGSHVVAQTDYIPPDESPGDSQSTYQTNLICSSAWISPPKFYSVSLTVRCLCMAA
jgi:hypothetical protein